MPRRIALCFVALLAGCVGGRDGSLGGLGEACASGADCASGLCVSAPAPGFCTAACGGDCDCRAGFTCTATEGGGSVCAPGVNACSTPPTGCDACGADEVCTAGRCEPLPSGCPCPIESYCDIARDTCVVGCTGDDRCDAGRICDPSSRTCRDGCRSDADCGGGQICLEREQTCAPGCRADTDCGAGAICDGLTCRPGCRSDADCAASEACVAQTCERGCRGPADCPASASCVDATCQCPVGQTACGDECVDTSLDARHCGGCGFACGDSGSVCRAGECLCPPGLTSCDGACVDLETDVDHCGRCETDCGPGTLTTCEAARCNNGPQPDSGTYSSCRYNSDCSWDTPDGSCIYFTITGSGVCTAPCAGPTDSASCDATPGGTATPTCAERDDGAFSCILDCSEGTCPSGMRCIPASIGPMSVRMCL